MLRIVLICIYDSFLVYLQGDEYVFESNWGEQLSSVVNPIPVVINLLTEECVAVDISEVGDISCKYYVEEYIY